LAENGGENVKNNTQKLPTKSHKHFNSMTKISFFIILSIAAILSCKGPTPELFDEPLPAVDGKLSIKFADSRLETKADLTLANDDILSISFNIKKSIDGNKPLKMAVYVANTLDTRGVLLLDNIKLKDADDQTKSVELSLPPVGLSINRFFYVEITDNKGKITRKTLNLLPSEPEQISSWANVSLGVQTSNIPTRFSSATGDAYVACDLDSNINFVDITYATIGSPSIKPTLLSNPRRGALGLGITASDKFCTGTIAIGGTSVYFAPLNVGIDFSLANDLVLKSLAIPVTTQELPIEAGKVYMFQYSRTAKDGKPFTRKGLIKINSISNITLPSGVILTSGLVNFDVKVQK
jgi:hypothetical protein